MSQAWSRLPCQTQGTAPAHGCESGSASEGATAADANQTAPPAALAAGLEASPQSRVREDTPSVERSVSAAAISPAEIPFPHPQYWVLQRAACGARPTWTIPKQGPNKA